MPQGPIGVRIGAHDPDVGASVIFAPGGTNWLGISNNLTGVDDPEPFPALPEREDAPEPPPPLPERENDE
jgi:hypothetical protein